MTAHPAPLPAGWGAQTPGLTVAAAARRLGVAPGTLRTWARRYGIGPNGHAPGRHRRYSPEDLARLETMQRALVHGASPADAAHYALAVPPAAPTPFLASPGSDGAGASPPVPRCDARPPVGGRVLRLHDAGHRARGLGRAALALDATAVSELLDESLDGDGVEITWDEVVRPVLVGLGDRWAHTGFEVEIEHFVSGCVSAAFSTFIGRSAHARRGRTGADPGRPVLLAAMPGEQHTLPILALATALEAHGIAHRYLGADLPADALASAAQRTAPVAVVLWSQAACTADLEMVEAMPRTRPRYRTFAAGPGWDDAALPQRTERLGSLGAAIATITEAVLV